MTERPRPAAGKPRRYSFPRTERQVLSNGIVVHVATMRRLPVVSVLFMVDAGAERDSIDKAGVASLALQSLGEGSTAHDADALANAFERLGGSLDTDLEWNRVEGSTTVLNPRFDAALRLLGEVVRTPVFPERDVERLRDERLAELLQQRAEPRGLADDMFSRFVYSSRSRYGLPAGGDAQTVGALSRMDVEAHYSANYSPSRTSIVVAGDVEADTVRISVENAFGGWWGKEQVPSPFVESSAPEGRAIHLIEKSGAPQSELRIGHCSLPRRHPDFYAVTVMNAILGGLFNSRINLNLREAHAYTYGAFSRFDWRRYGSAFEVSTAVQSEVTAAAVCEVMGEIDRIRESRVDTAELTLAVDYLTGVFPIRFETTAAIADALAARESYGLDTDYYDTYRERMSAVTAEDVLTVAQRHLNPSQLQIVAVTDSRAVRGALESVDLGPIYVYDADGEVLSSP